MIREDCKGMSKEILSPFLNNKSDGMGLPYIHRGTHKLLKKMVFYGTL